jgi:hypothetical protein
MTVLLFCIVVALVILALDSRRMREPPRLLKDIVWMLNRNMVPHELWLMIPKDYTEREGHSLKAWVEPIFVDRGRKPVWKLSVEMTDPVLTSTVTLHFDKSGNLYE